VIDASAFQLLLMVLTGWLARREREVVDYLIEENRCLRRQLGTRRVRLTLGHRVLICDRDRKWSRAVRQRLGDAGIRVVLTPERAPNATAYAERFVRSIKQECLGRMIPLGERHFRRAITEFVAHYHLERNHQGLDNRLIMGTPAADAARPVRQRSRLGGLLNYYERAA
jgi:transposase InsO family protein